MRYSTTIHASIIAGRYYDVEIVVPGSPDPEFAMTTVRPGIQDTIRAIMAELDFRDLEAMIDPGVPSVWGLANYLMERCGSVVQIERVTVRERNGKGKDVSATVERT
jgi:hypothetical protein